MICIAVVGGKLQGTEALYLARKANIKTVLVDKNINAPAATLCDYFIYHHFTSENPIPQINHDIDLIFPALEDVEVLNCLITWSAQKDIPIAFDMEAFLFTQSKQRSDKLFQSLKLPAPKFWPGVELPVIIKPDQESGSRGVEIVRDQEVLDNYLAQHNGTKPVIQEYLEGPSYSIEVLGYPENYHTFQVTELHMDSGFDCCGVTAPSTLTGQEETRFAELATILAEAIQLKGIMDAEIILHNDELKLLEIDARLPSQTPITVYHSTGQNIVEQLCNLFTGAPVSVETVYNQNVRIEHILVKNDSLEVCGEHIMGEHAVLSHHYNFFGADEAITNYEPLQYTWVATMIFTGSSLEEVEQKRTESYKAIMEHAGKSIDSSVVRDFLTKVDEPGAGL